MPDPAAENLPSDNVFDQVNPDKVGALQMPQTQAAAATPAPEANPFDAVDPDKVGDLGASKSSATGAFARSAAENVVPAAGGLAAAGAGAELGAAGGALVGGPAGALVGSVVGGGAAAYLGASAVQKAQEWALSKLPDDWKESINSQQAADQAEHPTASFLGGLVPYAVTLRPGGFGGATADLPENATAFQRLMAHPVTSRLFGGAVMGGMQVAQDVEAGHGPNWTNDALATGFGMIFNKPTRFGEAVTELGARPARAAFGIEGPAIVPTVAQAGDAKVMGPGITEQVFQGAHEMNSIAAQTAAETARTEQALTGEPAPLPDLHTVARRMEPELFAHYDALTAQKAEFQKWTDEVGASPIADQHIAATEAQLSEVEPQIAAAYRRAADAIGAPTIETSENVPTTALQTPSANADVATAALQGTPIEAQRAFIANDVTQKLVAAGRPLDEAEASGALLAARYETRAARLGGAAGTPQDLYNLEGADIRGAPIAQTAAAPAEKELVQGGRELQQAEPAPTFYSAVERAVTNAKQEKADPSQWLGMLKNAQGVKPEEMQWLGLEDWLKQQKGSVTKQQVADYVRANKIDVQEVEKGTQFLGPDGRPLSAPFNAQGETKFGQYTLPGGKNYRELLLKLPSEVGERPEKGFPSTEAAREYNAAAAKDYHSSHWDEPNILAHIRFDDREIDGKRALHLAEVQSDWHQAGRKRGYQGQEVDEATRTHLLSEREKLAEETVEIKQRRDSEAQAKGLTGGAYSDYIYDDPEWIAKMDRITEINQQLGEHTGKVPDAPFKTTWPELAMKRMIRYAAENGYDKISWDTGATNADRYDLSKQISRITLADNSSGGIGRPKMEGPFNGGMLHAYDHQGREVVSKYVNAPEELPDLIGKEAADKIMNVTPREGRAAGLGVRQRTLEGLDLKIGGEGMRGFYDQILPAAVNKLAKKFGGKVTQGEVETGDPNNPTGWESTGNVSGSPARGVHILDITPELHDAALEQGFPLFQGARGKINIMDGRRPIITLMKDANASTFIHESGHQWLEELMRDSAHDQAPDQLKADAQTTRKYLGVIEGEGITTRQHEKFARSFEQYMREGIAPSPGLARVFAQFRNWLVNIYQTLKGLGAPINEDIRGVFDRMLSTEPQRTVIAPERIGGPSLVDIHAADAAHTEPHEALPAGDRVMAELNRAITEPPPEVAHEIAPALQETEAAIAAEQAERGGQPGTATGTEPAGQVSTGAGAPEQMVAGGTEPKPVTASGGMGVGNIEERGSGGDAVSESDRQREPTAGRPGNRADTGPQQLAPGARQSLGARESPFLDKAGNIRIENLTTNQDVAQAIRDAADENDEFMGDRRGVVTDGQVMDLADALGMTFEKLNARKIGQAFNAEQVVAARKLLIQSATDVSAAMKAAALDSASDEDILAYATAKDRHQMIQAQVAGITAEAGRALRAFRSIVGQETAQGIDQFIKGATGKTLFQLRAEAKLGSTLDSPEKISKFLNDAQKRTFGRMVLEYWINGLISGPSTHVTYMIGNTILAAEKMGPETAAASLIGRIRQQMGRPGETVRLGEVGAQLHAATRAIPAGVEAAIEAFRSGATTLLPGETARPGMPLYGDANLVTGKEATNAPVTWAEVGAQTFGVIRGLRDGIIGGANILKAGGIEGAPLLGLKYQPTGAIPDIALRGVNVLPVGTALRIPSRAVGAIHSFFRAVNYSMDKGAQAYRIASSEGLKGTAFDARVADIRQNPSEEVMEKARASATQLTLMGKGSEFVQALSRLTNANIFGFPLLKFVDPFVHIAGNIIDQSLIQRTPLGLLAPEIRADLAGKNGNIAQDTAMARMLVGTGLAITFGGLAAEGLVSGSGPSKPDDAAMWRLAGNQAHSVRIGDIWYDVHRLGPMGMLLGVAADMYDVAHTAEQGDMLAAAAALQHAIQQNILDESFMKGPADLIQAVEDPGRYGEGYLRSLASGFVPYSVGLAQMARAQDPYSRQARTVMDSIKAKVPGLSETLFPRRDIWGEPMPNRDAVGAKGLTAIYESQMSHDPVNQAMLNLGIAPAPVERKIRNVELTDQQYDDYSRIAGRATKMRLDAIVNSPTFQTWPNEVKHYAISEIIRGCREMARNMIMGMDPTIVSRAYQAKTDRLRSAPIQ